MSSLTDARRVSSMETVDVTTGAASDGQRPNATNPSVGESMSIQEAQRRRRGATREEFRRGFLRSHRGATLTGCASATEQLAAALGTLESVELSERTESPA